MADGGGEHWLTQALQDNYSLGRLVLLLAFSGLVVLGLSYCVIQLLPNNSEVEVSLDGSSLSIRTKDGVVAGSVLLHASELWLDTGVDVPGNAEIQLVATGRVNVAAHRLTDAGTYDAPLDTPWFDPEGRYDGNTAKRTREQPQFLPLLLDEGRSPGALLAVLAKRSDEPGRSNPRPQDMQYIGKGDTIRNTDRYPKRLYLTINDGILDFSGSTRTADSLKYYFKESVDNEVALEELYEECRSNIPPAHLRRLRPMLALHENYERRPKTWQLKEFRRYLREKLPTINGVNSRVLYYYHRWRTLKAMNHTAIFYEDNAGTFLVNYRISGNRF